MGQTEGDGEGQGQVQEEVQQRHGLVGGEGQVQTS